MKSSELIRIAIEEAEKAEAEKLSELKCIIRSIDAKHKKQLEALADCVRETISQSKASFSRSLMEPCVYFLLDKGRIIYVGQTINFLNRAAGHRDKVFDDFCVISCKKEHMDALESFFIMTLRPPLNVSLGRGSMDIHTVSDLAEFLGIGISDNMGLWHCEALDDVGDWLRG
jgi:hypothetical protein